MSYDAVLVDLELAVLRPRLEILLNQLHRALPDLATRYAGDPGMEPMLRDVDLYLTMPRLLLKLPGAAPAYDENAAAVNKLMEFITAQNLASYPLFGSTSRALDFSQFTPRGHYTQGEHLSQYFQAMIWLGRTELLLSSPAGTTDPLPIADLQRQTIVAALLAELARTTGADQTLKEIDHVLQSLVGASDNVTLPQIQALLDEGPIKKASQLLDVEAWQNFQNSLFEKSYAFQRLLSQVLLTDPFSPQSIEPPAAFLLLGQRFIIDSYVTANVVFDKIEHDGVKVFRGLPSTLDVAFALGNDVALPLLTDELEHYHYAPNLAALRYLVDSYEPAFWNSTLYNGWLDAIRTLSPPAERTALPPFMQTAAWWQYKMNTQLAAWAQLRHDNLLYAKQSYSGGIVCQFPESYVEPVPAFYQAVKIFAQGAATTFAEIDFPELSDGVYTDVAFIDAGTQQKIVDHFGHMAAVADTLDNIAQKQLDGTLLDPEEKYFLQTMLFDIPVGCTTGYEGWYSRLFYKGEADLMKEDLVVADVHTQPTDAAGNLVGRVLHAGTGPLDMAVVVGTLPDGQTIAFTGPVMSYYEHVSLNFKRLTDEEWRTAHANAPSFRPDFAGLFLADGRGVSHNPLVMLPTAVEQEQTKITALPVDFELAPSYPNPFNSSTLIRFSIPAALAHQPVELTVYNTRGQVVKQLVDTTLQAGRYSVRWDGTTDAGTPASSGVYSYQLRVGAQQQMGKVSLVK